MKIFRIVFLICPLLVTGLTGYGQARSSVGIGAGVNKTFASGYNFGYGFTLQGSVKLSKKFALVPSLGLEKINADYAIIHEGYNIYTRSNMNLFSLGISGKYYLKEQWFVRAGTLIYLGSGNEDLVAGGFGGTAALGYDVPVNNGHNLELTLRSDLIELRNSANKLNAVVGLRVAYNF